MRLINVEYEIDLELKENVVNILVVENPKLLAELITELASQCMGKDGSFVLSHLEKLLKIEKEFLCVLEPFTIDLGDKRILTKLYQEINLRVCENMVEDTVNLNAAIIAYLDKAIKMVPYALSFQCQMDNIGIYKLFNLSLNHEAENLLEKIIDYLRAMSQLCGYKVVVFLNLKSFLSSNDLNELYSFAFYNKIHLVLIENNQYVKEEVEKICIIDKDKCIIHL